MLRQRVITALILAALLLPTLFTDSALPFSVLVLALVAGGAWEWGRLCGLQHRTSLIYGAVAVGLCLSFLLSGEIAVAPSLAWPWLVVAWVAGCCVLLPVGPSGWARMSSSLRLLLGLVVLISTWLAFSKARAEGVNFLLSVMCIVFASDISAYFAGHRWGRRKLAPRISPGKSWEGVMGAYVGVLVLALLWMLVEHLWPLGSASVYSRAIGAWGPVGLVIAVVMLVALGVVGDLFESLMKRSMGVKDSSRLLPGHGGVLDRVDALLPVLPAGLAILALTARAPVH